MRKIIVSEFITLDGVIQTPDGAGEDTEGGFEHGGWTWPYWDDKISERLFAVIGQGESILLGRKTWEIHGAEFEPMADDGGDILVDELNLAVYPIVLGSGKKLFSEATPVPSGVVMTRYVVARPE